MDYEKLYNNVFRKIYTEFEAEGKEHYNLESVAIMLNKIELKERERIKNIMPFGLYAGKNINTISREYLINLHIEYPAYMENFPDTYNKVSEILARN